MKLNLLLISALLFNTALGADKNPAKAKEQYGAVTTQEDGTLQKLLSVPGVDEKYKECQKNHPTDLDKIPECIWSNITPDQQKQVKDLYAQEDKKNATAAPVDANAAAVDATVGKKTFKADLTDRKLDVGIDYKSDPTVKALSDFFGKKLDEALNGNPKDAKDKSVSSVDHKKFIDLYTNELGKSVVNAFTSYCMETKSTCVSGSSQCLIDSDPNERKKDIKSNLDYLRQHSTFSDSEGEVWKKCIADVSKVCYETDSKETDPTKAYSRDRACVIMDFVKSARKSLQAANDQKTFYDGLKAQGIANVAFNVKAIDNNDKKLTADQLTQITSEDIGKDFKNKDNKTENIAKVTTDIQKEADECTKDNAKINDQEKCKKFLDTNANKNSDAVAEFGLRQFAKGDDLSEKLKNDDSVKAYLKEEGYSDSEIQQMTSKDKIQGVRDQIAKRYENEKNAIIKAMADKVSRKTASTDGKIEEKDANNKMSLIKEDLKNRNEDLKNLIHFNNIVSSYLTIEDQNKKSSRNTASLFAEVQSYNGADAEKLKDNLKNNKDLKQDQTSSNLDVNTINKSLIQGYIDDPNANAKGNNAPTQNP